LRATSEHRDALNLSKEFFQGRFLAFYDPFPGLPDNVAYEPGNVDRVVRSAPAEIFDQPLFGLIMNKFIVMTDAGLMFSV